MPPPPAPLPDTPHDEFFKEIFGDLDHARDLLRGLLPPDLLEILDLDQLQREDASFLTASLAEDFADLVFSCPANGATAWVALLLEHKSWAPRHPHLQLLTYMLGIWERAEKQGLPSTGSTHPHLTKSVATPRSETPAGVPRGARFMEGRPTAIGRGRPMGEHPSGRTGSRAPFGAWFQGPGTRVLGREGSRGRPTRPPCINTGRRPVQQKPSGPR